MTDQAHSYCGLIHDGGRHHAGPRAARGDHSRPPPDARAGRGDHVVGAPPVVALVGAAAAVLAAARAGAWPPAKRARTRRLRPAPASSRPDPKANRT